MGYRDVSNVTLMKVLLGRPYIDVRASFNSFIPSGISDFSARKRVNAYLKRLDENPQLHDKVEFDVVPTVLDFNFDDFFSIHYSGVLSDEEYESYRSELHGLTVEALSLEGTLKSALDDIAKLDSVSVRDLTHVSEGAEIGLESLPELLEKCISLGTKPFSIIARHAFIAESLLRSAVTSSALSMERFESFKASIRTISGEMADDFKRACGGTLSKSKYFDRYGHLRPGTYDIQSLCYRDREDLEFQGDASFDVKPPEFLFTSSESKALSILLDDNGFSITPEKFFQYAKIAISGREYAKFSFTRILSALIENIATWGIEQGLSREELSWLELEDILAGESFSILDVDKHRLAGIIKRRRQEYEKNSTLRLGYILRDKRDLYVVPQHRSAANYIGRVPVFAETVTLNSFECMPPSVEGKIVCIENADPGYDWLFSCGIAGLVTEFGGSNSHMAIRCAEHNIPAAVGVGEQQYLLISSSSAVQLDPAEQILRPTDMPHD
jgi:phosphohistidine swiveling domain-containing protein